tara:strand:+ start:1800 stop:2627 length:828 start_codon:yes stop_codon:yes gene_type:complete
MEKKNIYLQSRGGFGNRMWFWGIALEINRINKYNFNIVMSKYNFPEIKYIDFPHTIQGDIVPSSRILEYENLNPNQNYKISADALNRFQRLQERIAEGMDTLNGEITHIYNPQEPITLKDKKVDSIVRDKMKDVVGIHIRRGDVSAHIQPKVWAFEEPNHPEHGLLYYLHDEYYIDQCDKILQDNPNQEFYLSTDGTWSEIQFMYDRYNIINPFIVKNTKIKNSINVFTEVEANDIMSLIYCKTFIAGISSWSEFVKVQKGNRNVIERSGLDFTK